MRILFLMGFKVVMGGHFRTAQAWMTGLIRMGHDVRIAAWQADEELLRPFLNTGAKWLPLESFGGRPAGDGLGACKLQTAIEIARYVRREKIEVIHVQDGPILSTGFLSACLAHCRFVFSHAGGEYKNLKPPKQSALVVLSRELQDGYRAEGHASTVVSARMDRSIYRPLAKDETVLDRYRIPRSGTRFFTALRIGPPKRLWLESLLQMVEQTPFTQEVHFVIAGSGRLFDWMQEQVSRLNSRKGSFARIHLTGPVYDPQEICRLYNAVDVVLGNGRSLMEAMCCGRPVISLGEHGEAEPVTPQSIDRIAYCNFSGRHFRGLEKSPSVQDAVMQMLAGTDLEAIGRFGLQYAERELDAKRGAGQLLSLYQQAPRPSPVNFPLWEIRRKLYFRGIKDTE